MTIVTNKVMKRFISLFLALIMMLGALSLVACTDPGENEGTTSEGTTTTPDTTTSEDTTTTTPETTKPATGDKSMTIAGVDVSEYVIVRTYMTEEYAKKIAARIKEVSGYDIPIVTEAGDNEHIIDLNTSYNGYCETLVCYEDDKLIVTTSSSAGLDGLYELFVEATTPKNNVVTIADDFWLDGGYELKSYSEYNRSDLKVTVRTENAAVGYYKAGDAIPFIISLKDNKGNLVACPYFSYNANMDGATGVSGKVDGMGGEAVALITTPNPGFITATFSIHNGKNVLPDPIFTASAAASAEELVSAADTPADFEDFWKAEIEKLLKIDPVATKYEETTNSKISSGYKGYIVEVPINENGDFVTGIVTIPNNAKAGTLKIVVEYMYYSNASNVNAILSCQSGTIKFSVLAHGVHIGDTNPSSNYHNQGNSDKNTSYFKNMYLRDVQAIRFLIEKFGENGEKLWNGKDITVTGGSQGAAQSIAVAGLAEFAGIKITKAQVNVVWMCDLAGYKDPVKRLKSTFIPNYTDALLYFDVTNFAKYITADVSIMVGLADTVARPSGITCLYNAITSKKAITYIQGGDHTTYWDGKWVKTTINGNIGE